MKEQISTKRGGVVAKGMMEHEYLLNKKLLEELDKKSHSPSSNKREEVV